MSFDDPVNQKIRERIRNIRQQKRLSVRKAALLSEIPESSYSCMENGFYRISLFNLKKILDGLGVGIADVWPGAASAAAISGRDLTQEVDLDQQRHFRFQEIYRLSDANRAVLLEGRDRLKLAYSLNLSERDRARFLEFFPERLHSSWSVFSKENQGFRCFLCLQNARVEGYLKRLVNIYLGLWLAENLSAANF